MHPRTASPSLHSCPASDRASSFLLASALLVPPPSLATRRWARREMRPTDFCHPCEKLRAPAPRSFPVRSAAFAAWAPRGFWDPRGLSGGPGVSRRLDPLRRDEIRHSFGASRSFRYRRGIASVGVVFPRCRFDRASDIPVASPSSRLRSCPFEHARFTRSTPRRVGEK